MRVSRPVCFGELESALAHAAGEDSLVLAVNGETDLHALANTFALGIHFTGLNGTGSSITIAGGNCTGGYWNTGQAWKDKISPSFHGCHRLVHYDLPNKGGLSQTTMGAGTTKNLTTLNNRTESVSYHSN